jgi:hypothetical protein
MAQTGRQSADGAAAGTLFRYTGARSPWPQPPRTMPPTQVLTRVQPLGNVQARKPRVGQASRRVDGEPGCVQLGTLHSGKGAELPAASGHLRCCVGDDDERPTEGDGGVPKPARGYVLPKSCPGSKAGGVAGCRCLHLLCAGQASRCSARTRC